MLTLSTMPASAYNNTWREGWGFAHGKLSAFRKKDIVVLRGWPNPMAWRRTKTKPWRHTRQHADEVFNEVLSRLQVLPSGPELEPDPLLDDSSGWTPGERMPLDVFVRTVIEPKQRVIAHKFIESAPPAVLKAVAAYTDRRWHLLCLLARCPEALELAESQPALLFALASCWVFHRPKPTQPMRAVRTLIKKGIPHMWAWLGFPADERSVEMHSWLWPWGLTMKRLLNYRTAVQSEQMRDFLFHVGPLECESLDFAITPWLSRMVTASLLRNLHEPANWDLGWAQIVKDAMRDIRVLEKKYVIPALPRCKSAQEVVDFKKRCEFMHQMGMLKKRE